MTLKVAGGAWVPRGPAAARFGQPENIPNSPIAGAIEAVVAHPTNAGILWIGAVNGGIFRTDNATAASPHWSQQTDAEASLSIAALELDPTDATNNTLVAGNGLTSSIRREGGPRSGLLRTTDGGETWTALTALAGKDITGVAPRGSVIVASVNGTDQPPVACSDIGIFRSTNGGAAFSSISSGAFCGFSYDLASNPMDGTQLFTDHTRGTVDGIFRSDDTGANWTKVSDATMDALLVSTTRVEIIVGRAGAGAGANVYVAIVGASNRLAGLFRSGDAGATWTSLDLPATTEMGTSYGIHPGSQGSLHLSLVADPSNHDVVYVGGDRQPANNENGMPGVQFPNSIAASTYGGRLFRVDAGQPTGSQATPITNCPTASVACGGAARTVNDTAPHADSREMAFDADGDLIQTDDGGVYKHTDPSGSTGDWVSLIGDLRVIEQHDSDYDTISDVLISGNQDNGTTQQVTPGDDVWDSVFGGDGGDVVAADNDPSGASCTGTPPCSTRYLSAQYLGSARRRFFDSANAYQGFAVLGLTPTGGADPVSPQFVTPIEVNSITPSRMLLGAGNGIYESLDRLDTVFWKFALGGPVVNYRGGGTPITYGAAGDVAAFYFVSGDDVVSLTTALGAFLTDPDAGTDDTVGVVMDPTTAATAFVIDSDQVFQTTNGGSTSPWTDITGNLQTFSPGLLRSIEYVPSASGDGLVVGGTAGVFRALAPAFTTWDRLGILPNAPVFDLDYDSTDDVLAAGTLGRGAWTLNSASLQIHNLCNESFSLVTGQWKQISLACDPGGANTVAAVFGDDLTGIYGTNWVVWRHDEATQANVQLAVGDTLAVGEGYWIKTNQLSQTVDTGTTVNAVTDVSLVTSTADPPAGCGNSAGRCNMVGHPHSYDVCWADVQVIDGAGVLSLAEADPSGACQAANAAANGCVMSRIAHKWTGASHAPFDGTTLAMEGTTVPWDGFWVSAVKSGIQLRVPAIAGGSGLPCGNPRSGSPDGWYVRLIAESEDLRDASNVLGQLSDSAIDYDAHDLEELAPFGNPFLTVVFPHQYWGDHAGDYASDYHPLRPESEPDAWRFEVRSSDPAAMVTLRWEGPGSRLLGSVLTDVETGEQVAVAPDGSYAFAINGASRSFTWLTQAGSALIFADGFESGNTNAW